MNKEKLNFLREYDRVHRLTEENITDAINGNRSIKFVMDPVGNRLSKTDSVAGNTSYVYDANDRLLSETTNGQTKTYTYDQKGNTLSESKAPNDKTDYLWDDKGRLVQATITTPSGTKTVTYKYNENNIRVSQTIDGVETKFLIDANRDYAQVLEEYNPINGNVIVSYVYGHDLISQDRSNVKSFYLYDGLGSVKALTNNLGIVADWYNYHAYGNTLSATGSTINKYLYTGEQFDSNLGQYYLRDRFYNQNVGRFTRSDVWEGRFNDPLSLNKYLYTHGNPVNAIDPSGKFTLLEILGTSAIVGLLAGMASGYYYKAYLEPNSYCSLPSTDQEREHLNHAVTPQEFAMYAEEKTLEELESEAGINKSYGQAIPLGPLKDFRYVNDGDPNRATDMRHFFYFSQQGEFAGQLAELQQRSRGLASSGQLEDYRSNYFGTVFFKNYYTNDQHLSSAFLVFFNDVKLGNVYFSNCRE